MHWKHNLATAKLWVKSQQSLNKNLLTGVVNRCYITPMLTAKSETSEGVRRWFLDHIGDLWPLALGSISLRKSPCIRKKCSACASGKGHSSYALSGYRGGRRFSVYVPDELAPEMEKAVENGRRLEDLMKEAGIRYLKARKQERNAQTGAKAQPARREGDLRR